MTQQLEMLNRINERFGAHKFKLLAITPILGQHSFAVRFSISNFASFMLRADGVIFEETNGFSTTDRSNWLTAIALGYKRGEDGTLQPVAATNASPSADSNAASSPNNDPQPTC